MYWNFCKPAVFAGNQPINRNMRCIEISQHLHPSKSLQRLIKTWDVLKSLTDSVFGSGNPD